MRFLSTGMSIRRIVAALSKYASAKGTISFTLTTNTHDWEEDSEGLRPGAPTDEYDAMVALSNRGIEPEEAAVEHILYVIGRTVKVDANTDVDAVNTKDGKLRVTIVVPADKLQQAGEALVDWLGYNGPRDNVWMFSTSEIPYITLSDLKFADEHDNVYYGSDVDGMA